MMSGLAALLMLQAASTQQVQAATPAYHPLVQVFVSACVEGTYRPLPGSVRKLKAAEAPPIVRKRGRGDWTYLEISKPQRAFIVFGTEGGKRPYYSRVCQVKAQLLNFEEVLSQVVRVVAGRKFSRPDPQAQPIYYVFENYEKNYRFVASDTTGWVSLLIGHIGPGGEREFRSAEKNAQSSARRRAQKGP